MNKIQAFVSYFLNLGKKIDFCLFSQSGFRVMLYILWEDPGSFLNNSVLKWANIQYPCDVKHRIHSILHSYITPWCLIFIFLVPPQ